MTAASERGRPLRRVAESLGPRLLTLLHTPHGDDVLVRDVVVTDLRHPADARAGDLVVLTGADLADDVLADLAADAAASGAAALLVKGRPEAPPPFLRSLPLAVAVVPPEVEWRHLLRLLDSALGATGPDPAGPVPEDSVFALADVVAEICGGPVVLHDPEWRLLAYSRLQEPLDEARRQTILGRRAPMDVVRHLLDEGLLQRLRAGEVVAVGEPELRGMHRRFTVAALSGRQVLATIWLLPPDDVPDAQVHERMRTAAGVAATGLLRLQLESGAEEQERSRLLSELLTGGHAARALAERLRLAPGEPVCLLGLRVPGEDDAVLLGRLAAHLRSWSSAYRLRLCSAPLDATLFVLAPVPRAGSPQALAAEAHSRCAGQVPAVRLAVSSAYTSLADTPSARDDVAALLRLQDGGSLDRPIASVASDRSALQLVRLRDLLAEHPHLLDGPVQALRALDEERGGDLLTTLRVWFEEGGDARAAAERLTTHVNTVRYRLRKVQDLVGLDLDDPTQRFLAELHVRLGAQA